MHFFCIEFLALFASDVIFEIDGLLMAVLLPLVGFTFWCVSFCPVLLIETAHFCIE